MKKLPIGMQDYKELITENFVYVDKTKYLFDMIDSGKFYFISRPRRFGKSLTVSALYYLFNGEMELFKDTWIYDKWEFKEYPVIKISMADIDTTDRKSVEESLKLKLTKIYNEHNIIPRTDLLKIMFSDLIEELAKKEKVALLIDEYEKPILDHLQDKETAEAIRSLLRNFYIVIKGSDQYLKFVFMTGITKFTKTGVFSALNNLNELTTDEKYSEMFGYTQEELDGYFKEYIDDISIETKQERSEIIAKIKEYYDGFSFDGKHFVYNPFSILNYFSKRELRNYWMQSGSPSFIIDYAKLHLLDPYNYLHTYIREDRLTSYEIESAPPESFLVQSGYLTFKEKHETLGYLLDYPNKEVQNSFSELILLGTFDMNEMTENSIVTEILMGFEEHDFGKVFEQMNR
ncbi:MAG: AAA family ATPase, partial [Spirochaetia bacterium]|nr:AAA family ATPase [Spirochaetia bacterium]